MDVFKFGEMKGQVLFKGKIYSILGFKFVQINLRAKHFPQGDITKISTNDNFEIGYTKT